MTILLRALIYFSLSLVNCSLLNIYGSEDAGVVVANFSNSQLCNYTLRSSFVQNSKILNLDSKNGILWLTSSPNCNSQLKEPLRYSIQAVNITSNSLRTLEFIVIFIHDGVCSVKFQTNPRYGFAIISRDSKLGTKVFSLKDLFSSRSSINPRFLRIRNQVARDHFSIDSSSGNLLLRKSLIGKQQNLYNVIVEFPVKRYPHNHQSRAISEAANLKVYVDEKTTKVNKHRRVKRRVRNNPPQFSSSYNQASIKEDCAVGSTVTTIKATDVDSGSNGNLRYSMSPTQDLNSRSFFTLNANTGVITTTQRLDREKMDKHLFRVSAKDQGSPPLESFMTLEIIVEDVNDNPPIFESNFYATSVREDIFVGDTVIECARTG